MPAIVAMQYSAHFDMPCCTGGHSTWKQYTGAEMKIVKFLRNLLRRETDAVR
jgi:hypothetical protein